MALLRQLSPRGRPGGCAAPNTALTPVGDAPHSGKDGAERYTAFFVAVIRLHRANFAVLSAVRELAGYDPAVRDFYTADLEEFDDAVRRTLVEQQAAGATPPGLDATAASRVIVWGGGAAIARHIEVDDGSEDEIFARELGSIWWYGAYRRTTSDKGQSL